MSEWMKRTLLGVKRMSSQTKGAVTDVAAETPAVEEEAFSAEPLHHVHPFGAEVADVAAPEPRRELLTSHTLRGRRELRVKDHTFIECFTAFLLKKRNSNSKTHRDTN